MSSRLLRTTSRLSLDIAQQLRLVHQQRIALGILDTAKLLATSDRELTGDITAEHDVQTKEHAVRKQLRMSWSKLPPELLGHICAVGHRDLMVLLSRVCSSWRKNILTSKTLWRDLVVTPKDHSPHLKAAAYTKRAGSLGLRNVNLDMSFDFNDPPKHPRRVSARNDKKSTLQCILYAIDVETKRGVVHNLDYFRYFTKFPWHGLDIVYMLRFFIRPYVQPVKVRIESGDDTTSLGDLAFRVLTLLPAFNPRLAEVVAKGRANVRWRFGAPDSSGTIASRITELKACNVSRDMGGSWGSEQSNIKFFMHGLHAAATSRAAYKTSFREGVDLTYEPCAPGQGDLASHRAEAITRGWTTLGHRDDSDPVTGPPICLPNLRTLVVGAKDLGFLLRLEAPRLERLGVGTPPWLDRKELPRAREGDQAHVKLNTALRKFGGPLTTLDLRHLNLKAYPFVNETLHELCPHLQSLNIDEARFSHDFRPQIFAYLTAKHASSVGTRRLKRLVVDNGHWNATERGLLEGAVDELQYCSQDVDRDWAADMQDTYIPSPDDEERSHDYY